MTPVVLGLDTSNYRTSAAMVSQRGIILLNLRELLPVPSGMRGLRQNEAVFAHLRNLKRLSHMVQKVSEEAQIIAVCASIRPRDPEDSYMPVFETGASIGKVLAAALNVPFYETTHQRGHLGAAFPGSGANQSHPCLMLHLSGGTTEMLFLHGDTLERIGGSRDLHAGQLIDRAGVAMGLPFPSGPELEKLARNGKSHGELGVSMEQQDLWCHFSGAEAAAERVLATEKLTREDLAREIYDVLARTVARMLRAGKRKTGSDQALLFGGLASSLLFRELLEDRAQKIGGCPRLHYGAPELCGDNAVGVALIGWQQFKREDQQYGS